MSTDAINKLRETLTSQSSTALLEYLDHEIERSKEKLIVAEDWSSCRGIQEHIKFLKKFHKAVAAPAAAPKPKVGEHKW